jgi:predicted transcriptional regulator
VRSTFRYGLSSEGPNGTRHAFECERARGLTPAQYREKWSLPMDYPMVAPNYSKARSELAKGLGLGQTRKGKKAGKKRGA